MKAILFSVALLVTLISTSDAQQVKETAVINHPINIHHLKTEKMENQAINVVTTFLTAVQQGNTEKLGTLLHPEVQWEQPGNNRFSGTKKNITEVFQMVGGMFEVAANTLALTNIQVVAVNGNSVACLIHWNAAQPTGKILNVDNIDVYTVENGKITNAKVYSADLNQEDDFWGK
ncbi:nuclear transport factor 2 family protein [Chitinophaga defluvii]|uniref:Nuclear transport factor 2 family protein n=1 Tax=Chitinophaga defluvii TaxID=3163343 RepID=A0ABV2T6U4_9BACT